MTIIDWNLKNPYKRRHKFSLKTEHYPSLGPTRHKQDQLKRRRLLRPCRMDRLTSLPNDLLARILSILPIKDVAATQVLSKGMKQAAFCCISSIDFDNSQGSHCEYHPNLVEKFSLFESFIDNILHKLSESSQKQPLTRFKLCLDGQKKIVSPFLGDHHTCRPCCFPNLEPTRLYAWISYPLSHCGLRELDLRFHVRNPSECKLPPGLFTCQSLELLRLDSNLEINSFHEIPLICLPNLKILHFSSLVFTEDHFVTWLVSNCPVLEDLALIYCKWMRAKQLMINSNSLRRLACLVNKVYPCTVVHIDTPNLEFITYMDTFPRRCSVTHMNSLVKACINFVRPPIGINYCFQVNLIFVTAMSNVQHLSLSRHYVQTFMSAGELKNQLPMFRNLKTLKLAGLDGLRWDIVLLMILRRSPMLETIVFSEGFFGHHYNNKCVVSGGEGSEIATLEAEGWRTATNIPSCFRSHLRKIVINTPCGCDRELNMMKFLLGNASVLKELVICYSKINVSRLDGHNADQFKKTLEKLPKASNSCSIMYCDDESTYLRYVDLFVI